MRTIQMTLDDDLVKAAYQGRQTDGRVEHRGFWEFVKVISGFVGYARTEKGEKIRKQKPFP